MRFETEGGELSHSLPSLLSPHRFHLRVARAHPAPLPEWGWEGWPIFSLYSSLGFPSVLLIWWFGLMPLASGRSRRPVSFLLHGGGKQRNFDLASASEISSWRHGFLVAAISVHHGDGWRAGTARFAGAGEDIEASLGGDRQR